MCLEPPQQQLMQSASKLRPVKMELRADILMYVYTLVYWLGLGWCCWNVALNVLRFGAPLLAKTFLADCVLTAVCG